MLRYFDKLFVHRTAALKRVTYKQDKDTRIGITRSQGLNKGMLDSFKEGGLFLFLFFGTMNCY
jgi:hypothetical protein